MRIPSLDTFMATMLEMNYKVYSDGHLNIVGWRNRFGRLNYFDDLISIFQNTTGGWRIKHYEATTLPGLPRILKPVNPKGAAILVPGQYVDTYAVGLHRAKYRALIQVLPVKVYRDSDRDSEFDLIASSIDEGLFGINIHRASVLNKLVGADSAGCQVIHDRWQYEEFIQWCVNSKQQRFTYTLVEI